MEVREVLRRDPDVMDTVARGREGEGPRWGFTVFPHPGDSPAVVKPHPRALAAAVIRA